MKFNKSSLVGVGLFLQLIFPQFGFTASESVSDINRVIQSKGGQWTAKENWLTRMGVMKVRALGLSYVPEGQLDFEGVEQEASASSSIDWRNNGGIDWIGPAMNQGNCGSCVAFAAVATLSGQVAITNQEPWLRPSYSPQALFSCGGGACDYGWRPSQAGQFLTSEGVPDEACMPYTSGSTGEDVACSEKCSNSSSRTFTIANSRKITSGWGGSIEQVKAALKQGPLVTTLTVYSDFMTYSSGVYKHVTGKAVGGHAISIVGYDDAKRAWIIRNSWGPEWGIMGFGLVSWDDISGVGGETWHYDVKPSGGSLAVTTPADRAIISDTATLTMQGQNMTIAGTKAYILDSNGAQVEALTCEATKAQGTTQSCTAQFNTTALPDGRYQIYAENSKSKSQTREFFILNSTPNLTLSFEAAGGEDLSKPVKGRPEFYITAKSGSSVPMELVEFQAFNAAHELVSVKSNPYVLEKMKMGWRSTTVPNGTYEIKFHGTLTHRGKTYTVDSAPVKIQVAN